MKALLVCFGTMVSPAAGATSFLTKAPYARARSNATFATATLLISASSRANA